MSEIVTKVDLTAPDGVLLNTARRYCRHPILVLPRLHPLEVNENGIYPVPRGYAGHGQVKVAVTPKKETALVVTENGTYTPPKGMVYTSVTVRVTAGTAGDHTCNFAAVLIPAACETGGCRRYTCTICGKTYDTDLTPPTGHTYVNGVCTVCGKADPDHLPEGGTHDILLTVGQTFSLNYDGSSPTVECPACLRVSDDGGLLIFTAIAAGSGTVYLRRSDTLIAAYRIRVTAAETDSDTHIHTFTAVTVAPTCEAEGYTAHTCSICGYAYRDDPVDALGHDWAARAHEGFSSGYGYVCTRCGALGEELEMPDSACRHHFTFTHTVAPSCESGGYDIYTCSLCGAVERRNPTEAKGHTWAAQEHEGFSSGYGYVCSVCGALGEELDKPDGTCPHNSTFTRTVAPSCESGGYDIYTCSLCGAVERRNPTEAKGHTWAAREHEGFSSGYGYVCSVCGALGEELDKPACDHMWEDPQTIAPTCTKGGYTAYTCSICGTVEKMEYTDPLGHAWEAQEHEGFSSGYGYVCTRCGALGEELDKPACTHPEESVVVEGSVSASCESGGSITYRCTRCGESWTDTVDALGHSWLAQEHSGFSSGYGYVCTRCGSLGEELSIPECDHMWEDPQTLAATCTAGGYTTYTCSVCGTVKNLEHTDPLGHNYRATVTAPTCTEGGYTTHTCSRCGDSYRDTPTEAAGHAWSGWTVDIAPTCDEDGTEQRTCTVCGKKQTNHLEALGHTDTSYHEGRAATCTAAGYTAYNKCNVCGEVIDGMHVIPALGHDLTTEPERPATCTEYGRTALTTCSRCDYSSGGEEIEPNGHNWGVGGGWVTVTEATCTSAGEEKHTCNTCGETETRTIAPLGHQYSAAVTAPTCTASGYTTYTCSRCGHSYTSGKTAALGHSKGEPELIRAATCTVPPLYVVRCTRCGAELERYEDDGAMLEHISNGGRITVEPTCTASGTREYRCTVCGALIRTESVPATGHIWEYWEDSSASSGYSRTCEICGETESDVTP